MRDFISQYLSQTVVKIWDPKLANFYKEMQFADYNRFSWKSSATDIGLVRLYYNCINYETYVIESYGESY